MDVLDRPQLKPQQLNRALCVQQLRFLFLTFTHQVEELGFVAFPSRLRLLNCPALTCSGLLTPATEMWLRKSQLLIATAFCMSALFLKLHHLAKKQTNKQKKGCPQVFCSTAKFYLRRGKKLRRTATAEIPGGTLRADFCCFVVVLHNPIPARGFPHLLKTW